MKNMLKTGFETIVRLMLAVSITFTNFGFITNVFAETYTKGQVIEPTKVVGSTSEQGNVKLTKTVTATDEEGIFNVSLTAEGKDKITTESKTAPVYVAVVLDTSGSMKDKVCLEFGVRRCSKYGEEKYKLAKEATTSFATELLKKYDKAQLALVTFAASANEKRAFANSDFSGVTFPNANGGTNLGAAIKKANDLLQAKKNDDAKLFMVIVSDGYPEGQTINHKTAADAAKEKDVEIFTVGYDIDYNDTAKAVLNEVASTPKDTHALEAGADIVSKLTGIVSSIEVPVVAGTNATITDVIGESFTYVSGSATPNTATVDGQDIKFGIGDITEDGTTVSFKIKIDKDLPTGLYETNDYAQIDYKDTSDKDAQKKIEESPKVYWEQEQYNYTVNYYKDSVDTSNFLGTEQGQGVVNYEVTSSDLTKLATLKPAKGYKDGVIVTTNNKITNDIDNPLVVNVVYNKKDNLSYTVKYYKDALTNPQISNDADNTVGNKTYKEKIQESEINKDKYLPTFGYQSGKIETTMPYEIDDAENVIKVCYYKRSDLKYIVKYVEKGTTNEILASKTELNKAFEATYTETAKPAPFGYNLADDTTKTITMDADNKELKFNYEKRSDFAYTVKYLEKDTNITLASEKVRTGKTYLGTYTEEAITVSGYNVVGSNTQSIVIDSENKVMTFYYTKKTNLSYTVKYYKDALTNPQISNDADNTFGNKTYKEKIQESQINKDKYLPTFGYQSGNIETTMPYEIDDAENVIKVCYYKRGDLKYTVKYVEKGTTNEILASKTETNKTFEATYTETAKPAPFGYNLADDTTKTITMDADNKELKFNYEKRSDFAYTVKYLEKDTNVALAPSKVESNKTYLGTYTEEAITVSGYNVVGSNTQNVVIDSENKEITFYYTKKTDLTYRVEYYYDDNIDSSKTEVFGDQTFGTVIDSYEQKQPFGYEFVSDTAPLTIEDSRDNVIKVYYKSVPQGDITAPETGITSNTACISMIYLVSTLGYAFINRKEEN